MMYNRAEAPNQSQFAHPSQHQKPHFSLYKKKHRRNCDDLRYSHRHQTAGLPDIRTSGGHSNFRPSGSLSLSSRLKRHVADIYSARASANFDARYTYLPPGPDINTAKFPATRAARRAHAHYHPGCFLFSLFFSCLTREDFSSRMFVIGSRRGGWRCLADRSTFASGYLHFGMCVRGYKRVGLLAVVSIGIYFRVEVLYDGQGEFLII